MARRSSTPLYTQRKAPAVKRLLPPDSSSGARSSTRTDTPCSAAAWAAQKAALPAPIMMTSLEEGSMRLAHVVVAPNTTGVLPGRKAWILSRQLHAANGRVHARRPSIHETFEGGAYRRSAKTVEPRRTYNVKSGDPHELFAIRNISMSDAVAIICALVWLY